MSEIIQPKLVVIESPFAGETEEIIWRNIVYGRFCMRDCFRRGEAPYASHLLYTLGGVLNDKDPGQRKQGMGAGFAWGDKADLTVVYGDLGITPGMQEGIDRAVLARRPYEKRFLFPGLKQDFHKFLKLHPLPKECDIAS